MSQGQQYKHQQNAQGGQREDEGHRGNDQRPVAREERDREEKKRDQMHGDKEGR